MADHTLSILTPSVNNLTARIFVRAAGLDFEEVDVWGKTMEPEYLAKYPAHLTPTLEEAGLPRGAMGESCAICAYLCNKHGLDQFYPTDPGERAMVRTGVAIALPDGYAGLVLPRSGLRFVLASRVRTRRGSLTRTTAAS